jgi:16S rRNA (guanine1516-N2)-methyltransferase
MITTHIATDIPILENLYQVPLLQPDQDYDYLLTMLDNTLQLVTKNQQFNPLVIDFTVGRLGYRLAHRSFKNELIAKACGLKTLKSPTVLDTTAGLGKDAFILASFGCQVTLLERNPIVAALLADGLIRGAQDPAIAEIIARMTLIKTDAKHYCAAHPKQIDIVYVDPMFPAKTKSALAKKEMQIFQDIITDHDSDELFELAKTCATSRVVVKRPLQSSFVKNEKPDIIFEGKSHRFDVYTINQCRLG